MQTFLKRFSVVIGFAILVVVLIANTVVTRRQLGVQVKNDFWASHAREVLLELEEAESVLKDAETGQRGYLYTGDPQYLTPYETAHRQVNFQIDELARLTANNPRQQASINELRGLAAAKLAELSETVSLYKAGRSDEARAIVLSNKGLEIMDHIRAVTNRMRQEESSLQSSRTASYLQSVRVTVACIYVTTSLSMIGLVLLAYYIIREMKLREKHSHEIRAREEWFRVTLTSIGDAVIATDQQGKVLFLNSVAEELTGSSLDKVLGRDIAEVFPIFNEYTGKAAENPVRKVLDNGMVVGLANHTVLKHADGRLIPIEDSAAPIRDDRSQLVGVVLVFRDVTSERKSQEMARRSEKLAAAARLSATVAHEINNPLEAISNLVFIARESAGAPPEVVHALALAEKELERVAHITRQTLGFYRESNAPERVEIAPLIDSVLGLYSNKLRAKKINVKRELGESPPVVAVAGELRQAISNLISNALDAVPIKGTIHLKAQCLHNIGASTVQLLVEDDGPGIPPENIEKIFEPFFTTKKDIGTGLGLWVTREILERHGGSITLQNGGNGTGQRGARFVIQLPCNADYMLGPSPNPHVH